jgi:hypothetical protein
MGKLNVFLGENVSAQAASIAEFDFDLQVTGVTGLWPRGGKR